MVQSYAFAHHCLTILSVSSSEPNCENDNRFRQFPPSRWFNVQDASQPVWTLVFSSFLAVTLKSFQAQVVGSRFFANPGITFGVAFAFGATGGKGGAESEPEEDDEEVKDELFSDELMDELSELRVFSDSDFGFDFKWANLLTARLRIVRGAFSTTSCSVASKLNSDFFRRGFCSYILPSIIIV